jgi:hypothetical protein
LLVPALVSTLCPSAEYASQPQHQSVPPRRTPQVTAFARGYRDPIALGADSGRHRHGPGRLTDAGFTVSVFAPAEERAAAVDRASLGVGVAAAADEFPTVAFDPHRHGAGFRHGGHTEHAGRVLPPAEHAPVAIDHVGRLRRSADRDPATVRARGIDQVAFERVEAPAREHERREERAAHDPISRRRRARKAIARSPLAARRRDARRATAVAGNRGRHARILDRSTRRKATRPAHARRPRAAVVSGCGSSARWCCPARRRSRSGSS